MTQQLESNLPGIRFMYHTNTTFGYYR